MKKLPRFLQKYFWEVDFEKIDKERSKIYILKRILEYGDEKACKWMFENFKKEDIKNVLCNYRGYSRKSANFWAVILDIPQEKVLCLKKRSSKELEKIWPY